jgi:hypothetical protein
VVTTVYLLLRLPGGASSDGGGRSFRCRLAGSHRTFALGVTSVVFVIDATGEATIHYRSGIDGGGRPSFEQVIGSDGLRVPTANLSLSSSTGDLDRSTHTAHSIEGNSGEQKDGGGSNHL